MNEKGNEMTDKEFAMYGMTEADIRDEFLNGITAKLSGMRMSRPILAVSSGRGF